MELLFLSHVASLFPKQTLEYDPKRCAIINLEDANRWLSRCFAGPGLPGGRPSHRVRARAVDRGS